MISITPSTNHERVSVWTMHLIAVLLITLVAMVAMVWLTLANHPIPDIFSAVISGGLLYLAGTQAKDKFGGGGNDNK